VRLVNVRCGTLARRMAAGWVLFFCAASSGCDLLVLAGSIEHATREEEGEACGARVSNGCKNGLECVMVWCDDPIQLCVEDDTEEGRAKGCTKHRDESAVR
jgi:hypothetical protein